MTDAPDRVTDPKSRTGEPLIFESSEIGDPKSFDPKPARRLGWQFLATLPLAEGETVARMATVDIDRNMIALATNVGRLLMLRWADDNRIEIAEVVFEPQNTPPSENAKPLHGHSR